MMLLRGGRWFWNIMCNKQCTWESWIWREISSTLLFLLI